MKNTTTNDFEFVHDALDWVRIDYCEDHAVIKIVHNPGGFAVICSARRHGINILYTGDKLIPAVDYYREFKEMEQSDVIDYLAGYFRDEEGDF